MAESESRINVESVTGFEVHYAKFHQNTKLLFYLNKAFPNLYDAYIKYIEDETRQKFAKLTPQEKEQLFKIQEDVGEAFDKHVPIINLQAYGPIKEITDNVTEFSIYSKLIELFLREMSLVYLISSFEEFLKISLSSVFKIDQNFLKSNKTMTYEEIQKCTELEELREKMIDRITDEVINEDIEKINQYLTEHFKLNLKGNKNWTEFTERFYRRHIIIHNDSKPDHKYRTKTGWTDTQRINVDEKYLFDSITLFRTYAKNISDFFSTKYPQ